MKPRPLGRRALLHGFMGFLCAGVAPLTALSACGYSPLAGAPSGGLGVGLGRLWVAEPLVVRGALRGARRRLMAYGALSETSQAKLSLSLLRLDERALSVGAAPGGPAARGVELVLRASAAIQGGEEPSQALGPDVVRRVALGARPGLALDRDAALNQLGELTGAALAELALGLPVVLSQD
ncbi:MAG: hypothetical protein KIT72_11715 [Polyangiaceae bacterium]|nr:hypothetical protein [Polyangiaceae bacterium]